MNSFSYGNVQPQMFLTEITEHTESLQLWELPATDFSRKDAKALRQTATGSFSYVL
ncbi:hypothetical protein [Halocola ammonii]